MAAWLEPSIIAALCGSAILTLVYYYLYWLDREKFICLWMASWAIYSLRLGLELVMAHGSNGLLRFGLQFAALASGVLLLLGTYSFLGEKSKGKRVLYASPVFLIWVIVGIYAGFPVIWLNLPPFLFLGVAYIATGITILRHRSNKGLGQKITGWAFVLWGVHKTDYPFLISIEWFRSWGFLLGAVLALLVALGILLAYFEKTRQDLRQSNEDLAQFAYIVSHDLKAPLRAISSLSQWIKEDEKNFLTEDSAQHLEMLQKRVIRINRLIDGILDYSRIGRRDIKEQVDVQQLVEETYDLLSDANGHKVNIIGPMPVLVTERQKLQQVFLNLLDNAFKHHDLPKGEIQITAQDMDHFYSFTVSDDGPGISSRYHERIFGMFQTLYPGDKSAGTGIGLALVKRIIEEKGGSVKVNSKGRGTAITFFWPKDIPPD